MSENLVELVQDIVRNEKIARTDLDDIPSSTRAGWVNAIAMAKEEDVKLKRKYIETILRSSTGIFLTGDKAKCKEAAEFLVAAGEGLEFNADSVYTELSLPLEDSIGGSREFGLGQVANLYAGIREMLYDLHDVGVFEANTDPVLKVCPTFADIVLHVKTFLRSAGVGDHLTANFARARLTKQALEQKLLVERAAVAVTGTDSEDERQAISKIFGKGHFTIEVGPEDTINKEFFAAHLKPQYTKTTNKRKQEDK